MRINLILVLTLISICCAQREYGKYSEHTKATVVDIPRICINCIRKFMKNGASLPILSIPPLDPLHINKYSLKLDTDYARGNLTVEDFTIEDISDFTVSAVDENQNECFKNVQPEPLDRKSRNESLSDKEWKNQRESNRFHNAVEVKVNLETDYDADVLIMGFVPVFGQGHVDAELKAILSVGLTDEGTADAVKITDFESCLNIADGFTLHMSGLQDDDYLSAIIGKQVREILLEAVNDEFKDGISAQLDAIKTLINSLFGNRYLNMILLPLLDDLCGKDDTLTKET